MDGSADLGLNQEPRMTLVLIKSKALRVGETFYKKMGYGEPVSRNFRDWLFEASSLSIF
jgi:hypothetical protein